MEQEIAEILERTDQPASFTDHVRRKAASAPRPAPVRPRPGTSSTLDLTRLGPGSFLAGALGLALVAALVSGVSPLLGTLLGLLSVVSFVMVWVRRAPAGGSGPKMWRGQPLQSTPELPAWLVNLRDRFQGPPKRP
jgi:hypothetical protein